MRFKKIITVTILNEPMKYFFGIFLLLIFFSCKKQEAELVIPPAPEASYRVVLETKWSSPAFTVPTGVHITNIIGMVHAQDTFLWKQGSIATLGLENVAEVGNNTRMGLELDTIILKQKALSKFSIFPPLINGSVEFPLTFTTTFSYFSFASMIAPSPDWFMGISNYNLIQNNKWVEDITLDVLVYDAGTEEGDVFGYSNPATIPQQNIVLLTPAYASVLANGNAALGAIATIRFIKN